MRRPSRLLAVALLVTACGSEPALGPAVPEVAVPAASSSPAVGMATVVSSGEPAPVKPQRGIGFKLESVNGAGEAYIEAGKIHVIHIWATFCEPCKRSLPALQKLSDQYGGSGVRILALAEDDESSSVSDFASTLKISFPVAVDTGSAVAKALKSKTLPCTFVLDRSGQVRFVHEGYSPGDEAKLEEQIKSLLGAPDP